MLALPPLVRCQKAVPSIFFDKDADFGFLSNAGNTLESERLWTRVMFLSSAEGLLVPAVRENCIGQALM